MREASARRYRPELLSLLTHTVREPTLRLAYAPASPFARKAAILLHELNITDSVELFDPGAVTPNGQNADIDSVNPLGMIPVLILDDGSAVFDSPVICECLNDLGQGHFFPTEAKQRLRALQLQALADGIMDLSVAERYETALRPENLRWPEWIAQQEIRVANAISMLNQQCAQFDPAFCIGEVAVVAALGYRDFRYADVDWRSNCPALATWFEQISQRESVKLTVPD